VLRRGQFDALTYMPNEEAGRFPRRPVSDIDLIIGRPCFRERLRRDKAAALKFLKRKSIFTASKLMAPSRSASPTASPCERATSRQQHPDGHSALFFGRYVTAMTRVLWEVLGDGRATGLGLRLSPN
jgi:hypothetical protein